MSPAECSAGDGQPVELNTRDRSAGQQVTPPTGAAVSTPATVREPLHAACYLS
jgi:hypothetical protein